MPLGLGPLTGLPSRATAPRSGWSKPAKIFRRVDLPHPEGPMMATNSPSVTVKSMPSSTAREPFRVGYSFHRSVTVILMPIAPPYDVEPLDPPHQAIQQQANHTNDGHSGHYQVIPVSGVPRIDDQETEPRIDGDHFGGHNDQPCYPKANSHPNDNLGEGCKKD